MTSATFLCHERKDSLEIVDYFDNNNDKLPRRYKASRPIRGQNMGHVGQSEAGIESRDLSGPIRGQYSSDLGQSEALVIQICPVLQAPPDHMSSTLCEGTPEADILPRLARAGVSVTEVVTLFLIEARYYSAVLLILLILSFYW